MCSINEREATRLLRELDSEQIVSINRTRLCRVYPHYSRYASDNVEPELFANLSASGFQMVALNLQTPDDAFVYASALFSQNGGCGYLLAPPRSTGLALRVSLLSARHVPKVGEGRVAEPPPPWHGSVPRLDTKSEPPSGATEAADVYVTMQVIGPGFCCAVNRSVAEGPGEAADTDAVARLRGLQRCVWRSSTVLGNGFNAEWGVAHADEEGRAGAGGAPRAAAAEEAEVLASRPELSVLRVCVWSASSAPLSASNGVPAEWLAPSTLPSLKEVTQSSDTLLAYAAVPLLSLRGGVRALKMMHPRGEPIELCSVLCDISLADDAVPFDDLSGAGSTPPSALVPARSGKSLLRKFIMRRGTSSSTLSSCSGGAAVAPAAEA
ncbi:hypothetical protein EMIHUDRAFT_443371 [Emiliania huxleyi CCMP1516]|uniref:phosphoinositide phospholipase C n=2 Tax=Emiliania huxleyi TaxID=2903 RepID=A0A0D3JTI5_EMIH1|nr:hypothetical protein EMIHUDRAFT_443371 [Emiliania huxleyi CCMP1516]EOD26820.1 hypothetical protein EMIHUDRAFT_443371 [Emiliania huxleyi CCMP1516]|eukprot:XP_005779249.1 hypothetical protein EMIHUDRAFT_443371 [Emiliania huxleyi CCMP1516]